MRDSLQPHIDQLRIILSIEKNATEQNFPHKSIDALKNRAEMIFSYLIKNGLSQRRIKEIESRA